MKKLMAVLSAILLLWGCSDNNDIVEEESVKEEKIEVVEEDSGVKEDTIVEEAEENEEQVNEEVEEVEYSREDRVLIAHAIMADSFSSMSEVEYDSSADMLTIFPTDERFTMEIFYMMMGYEENIRDWNKIVEALSELSVSVSGIVDEDIQIAILNPEDSERVLLLVQDGFALYNFANEL